MEESILVVDDDRSMQEIIRESLERASFNVELASSAKEALALPLERFDLMIFDVMMPDMDGLELCRVLRERIDCPILFLSAKTAESDVVEGLALGGDDYIRKPFSPSELVSRVKAHLRRELRVHHATLSLGDVRFVLSAKEIQVKGQKLALTKTEYDICEYLARHRQQVFSREQLLQHCNSFTTESDPASISEHIKNIRKKFSAYDLDPIQTTWGIGYSWR